MTSRSPFIRHVFGGGWATDFGPSSDVIPENQLVTVPFLVDADNVVYELDGAPHKAPGASKLNTDVLDAHNLLTYSEQFDNAAWGKSEVTVSANAATDPTGGSTADKLVASTNSAGHKIQSSAVNVVSGQQYTLSVYGKAAGYDWLRISGENTGFGASDYALFDVSNGVIGATQSIDDSQITGIGNGWYRCSITVTATATDIGKLTVYVSDSNSIGAYAGDGSSGIFVWGAQLEERSSVGPYVQTVASAIESPGSTNVKGIYDYWITGTTYSATQHRLCHVGTKIKKDDADGSFSDIFTGLESGKVPDYTTFNDIVIIASDSTVDVPKSWDGTTAQNLAGSPPNFAFSVAHKNRVWAAGDAANPSKLYYSAYLNPEDWTGLGSGEINIAPDDGDRITGIVSFKDELWVFKGPYKGSIWRVRGSAPTGSDPFSLKDFVKGIGAVAHNTIFPFSDDIGFMWSDGSIRSLKATAAYGDFSEVALSRPISIYIREHFNFQRLTHAQAVTWEELGIVLFAVPIDTSQQPNMLLVLDYRFQNVRWARWSSFTDTCVSIASVVDSAASNRRIVMAGGNDGFIRKYGQATRTIDDSTSISYKVTLPHLNYGQADILKTLNGGSIGFQPKNDQSVTFGWTRDNNAEQTLTVTQGGTAVLDSFVLGTDTLGGARFVDRFFRTEEGGEFRSVSFEVRNNVAGEDVEIHSISAILTPGAQSLES